MYKIAIAIVLILLLSGCDRSDNAQNLPTTSPRKPIKPVISTFADIPDGPGSADLFLSTLQQAAIPVGDRDRTVTAGRTVCASMQTNTVLGATADASLLDHIADRLTKGTEFRREQTGVIIGAAIGAFCPEFAYLAN
ncbi:DUF732 domain-containing protein [Nocardia yunnanensis]|uniref:DUF732 domain-containing protein n=1 Tax=Nocardia yunnanensis TaxID=2382165 RepID=UPI0013C3EAF1|nr:DUF732 domain-containing protein [Nocardia yunnanensis]